MLHTDQPLAIPESYCMEVVPQQPFAQAVVADGMMYKGVCVYRALHVTF
jgi:hypothetical protein